MLFNLFTFDRLNRSLIFYHILAKVMMFSRFGDKSMYFPVTSTLLTDSGNGINWT